MKLNELKSGKRVWVLISCRDENAHTEDIELDGVYSSVLAAEFAQCEMWLEQSKNDILHSTEARIGGKDVVKQFKALLAAPTKANLAKFEDLANEQDVVEPSFSDWMENNDIRETTLK